MRNVFMSCPLLAFQPWNVLILNKILIRIPCNGEKNNFITFKINVIQHFEKEKKDEIRDDFKVKIMSTS